MYIQEEEGRKPGSVPPKMLGGDDHSSGADVTDCLKRPNPEAFRRATCLPPRPTLLRRIREGSASLFGLAPGGVCRIPVSPSGLVRSYRTVSPLPGITHTRQPFRVRCWRFVFCGTFLRVTPTGSYPAPCSSEPGLSSPRLAAGSDHLAFFFLENSAARHPALHLYLAIAYVGDERSRQSTSRSLRFKATKANREPAMRQRFTDHTRHHVRHARSTGGQVVGMQTAGQGLGGAPCLWVTRGPPRSDSVEGYRLNSRPWREP